METKRCILCNNEFRLKGLNEDGKCARCVAIHPDAKSRDDLKEKSEEDKENEGRMINVINREIIRVLREHKILQDCECGRAYYKRSPAQKSCGKCKGDK